MKDEKKIFLRETFPLIFRSTVFNHEDGWFKIVSDFGLTSNLYTQQKNLSFSVLKVQERFGILFIDYNGGDNFTRSLIRFAEKLSHRTCEVCGKPGRLHSSRRDDSFGKLATLCEEHALRRLYWKI